MGRGVYVSVSEADGSCSRENKNSMPCIPTDPTRNDIKIAMPPRITNIGADYSALSSHALRPTTSRRRPFQRPTHRVTNRHIITTPQLPGDKTLTVTPPLDSISSPAAPPASGALAA